MLLLADQQVQVAAAKNLEFQEFTHITVVVVVAVLIMFYHQQHMVLAVTVVVATEN